ncbi:MAG: S8 family serine peptidase [Atopobiaceae bacterium]|nr:S8 family serine peptidase [Atopobiaceae bacterium]
MKRRFGKREALLVALGIVALVWGIASVPMLPNVVPSQTEPAQTEQSTGTVQKSREASDSHTEAPAQKQDKKTADDDESAVSEMPDDYKVDEGTSPQEVEDGGVTEVFVMPEDVAYEPRVALCTVDPTANVEDVRSAINGLKGIMPAQITQEDVAAGVISVTLAEGVSVEDGVNELLKADVVQGAQPNYVYAISDLIDGARQDEAQATKASSTTENGSASSSGGEGQKEQTQEEPSVESDAASPVDEPKDQNGSATQGTQDKPEADGASQEKARENAQESAQEDVIAEEKAADESTDNALKSESDGTLSANAEELSAEASKASVNDPKARDQWGLNSIQAYEAWALQKVSGSVTVAVIDMGFDTSHPDLKGNLLAGYNAYTKDSSLSRPDNTNYGHGTHVAGIISGVSNNGMGVSGASYNAKILPITISHKDGSGEWVATSQTLINAMDYVIKNAQKDNIRVINLSIGNDRLGNENQLRAKIKEAYESHGIVTVASAGNLDGRSSAYAHYPSDIDECVAVMSFEKSNTTVQRSSMSNYNRNASDHKDIGAPGENILSTYLNGDYSSLSGSSMATPFVSSILALEFAANPKLTAQEAVTILYATAIDLDASGWDTGTGWGEANAYAAVYGAKYGINEGKKRAIEEQARRQKESDDLTATKKALKYRTHVQNVGWQGWKGNGQTSGTSGRGLRLEGIQIALSNAPYEGGIQYRTHVQNIGWQGWKSNGALSGTSGRGLRLEAIQIKLTGQMAEHYDVWYRVHAQDYGWLGWASNGNRAGTATYGKRLEAIQISIVPKGGAAPGTTERPYVTRAVSYRTHVQNVGWQQYRSDGAMSGTSGRGLRLEGINISLSDPLYSGGIQYRTHVQNIGWQGWRSNGAMSGTSGRGLRLEAIQIKLTGSMADHYDVWYRVHAQNFGWMGWTSNGARAGTAGYGYRLEGIQIRLVAKGGSAPGTTTRSFSQR